MKKVFVLAFGLLALPILAQENFIGLKSGYYTGVNQVTTNPANIATNHLKWNVNLLSLNANVATNEKNLNFKDLTKSSQSFWEQERSNKFSAAVHTDVLGPSFMFAIGEKHAVAFTTRTRTFTSGENLDLRFAQRFFTKYSAENLAHLPSKFSFNKQNLQLNVFSEIGVTWAGTIWRYDRHILKGGLTAKYVIGHTNSYININHLDAFVREDVVDNDTYLENTNADVIVVNSGMNINNLDKNKLLKPSVKGVGFDLGLIYEYRTTSDDPYIFKMGVALTDIGSLTYHPIKGESFQYKLNNARLRFTHFFEDLKEKSQSKTEIGAYKTSLPTALQMNFDYHLGKRFFIDLSGRFGLSKSNSQNPYYGNSLVLTPRFERKELSIYLPLSYDDFNYLNKTNIGFGLRVGPLTFGTSDIIAPFKKQVNDLNLFVGITFGQSR